LYWSIRSTGSSHPATTASAAKPDKLSRGDSRPGRVLHTLQMRSEIHVKEPEADAEVAHAVYYNKYEETDGVKHFTQIELRRDDKVLIEMELSDFQLPEQLGEEMFAKP
jgi:hypothetical protein